MVENEDKPRLIERGFCLKQASINSVHEKSVRHGHISTLHIWPARRPLAACRAALIATLLPDPGDPEKRKELLERIGGMIVNVQKRTKKNGKEDVLYVEETDGGILHWGRESGPDIDFFREEIRKAYGGHAPKVLDPFAGGGAIPFEAMRLGCEATASDINPVAWFIEKCTLEYPQRLVGQKLLLPDFILKNKDFMDSFYEAQDIKPSARQKKQSSLTSFDGEKMIMDDSGKTPMADLAWHIRAWGWWVLEQVKKDLEEYYPVIEDKPTVAYLWARTVRCKNCRANIPLLKTTWLCKSKSGKRVLLELRPNEIRNDVVYTIRDFNSVGSFPLKKEEKDSDEKGHGTMTGTGAWCPCCGGPRNIAMTRDDIKNSLISQYEKNSPEAQMVAVVVSGLKGKEYRLPEPQEIEAAKKASINLEDLFKEIPYGLPRELIEVDAKSSTWCVQYGMNEWHHLFSSRQLYSLGTLALRTREAIGEINKYGYQEEWSRALGSYLCVAFDRVCDYNSSVCHWHLKEYVVDTFQRFAIGVTWDYCEIPIYSDSTGGYPGAIDWIVRFVEHAMISTTNGSSSKVLLQSAINYKSEKGDFDLIITDPPYYDAISYSNLMDFFYVWIRRISDSLIPDIDSKFNNQLSPKWNHDSNDGELVDDSMRFGRNKLDSKHSYEEGMFKAFLACHSVLKPNGRIVVVFAHKNPNAWETLVSALIKSGFVVDASWPIKTEMGNRTRALGSAALSSSVWLVCKKRSDDARPGWNNRVLEEMRSNIQLRLREYWDAGIRGPDFIWAATGPALEAYSKHPIVKKADDPGQVMTVSEFLVEVRRIVMDFVVGRVLGDEGERDRDLDNITTYYLLHRHDFGFRDAPAGSCILYAVSCDLSDSTLVREHDILLKSGGMEEPEEDEGEETEEDVFEEGTSSTFRLKTWNKRKSKNLGLDSNGRPAPLIDRVHKLMHLWKEGDMAKVDEYLDSNGLLKNKTFHHILQAMIELSKEGDEERSLLESISNHIMSRGGAVSAPRGFSDFGG